MKQQATVALAILFLSAAIAGAQDAVQFGQPLSRALAPGAMHSYAIQLDAGDYVGGVVDQRGVTVSVVIAAPDGSTLQRFLGQPFVGRRAFAFAATVAGTYRLNLAAVSGCCPFPSPTVQPPQAGSYELQLTEKLALVDRLKFVTPMPRADKYTSSVIDALRKQVARGETSTDTFWRKIVQSGTPLVEPLDRDDGHVLVTFLWRGTSQTRNVVVLANPFPRLMSYLDAQMVPIQDYAMNRLAGTDVWYLSVKVPTGARFEYRLSQNDPIDWNGPRAAQRLATGQADPLNPRRWLFEAGMTIHEYSSLAELPGASPQPWIVKRADVPEGKLETQRISGPLSAISRDVVVYTPAGYRATGDMPSDLVIVINGPLYLELMCPQIALDNLIAASRIPSTVVVFVPTAYAGELPVNAAFADFLAKELVPWIRARYNVARGASQTVVAGVSFGGVAAAYVGLRHSETFGNVLCQSGSFWWAPDHNGEPNTDATTETGWLAKEFIKSPKLPLRFYMDAGTFEVDTQGLGGFPLESSRHMRDVLLAKEYEVRYQQFVGAHSPVNWRGTLADGLVALIGR